MILSLGTITNPLGENRSFEKSGGIVGLITSSIRLLVVIAGVFALFNFVTAGLGYITSQGDPKALELARQKIFMSVIGLLIIAASFLMAGLAGWVIFGDAGIFLFPKVYGPGEAYEPPST